MTEAPVIFDRALTQRRQLRALAQGPADFLLRAAIEELAGRLSAVQREFACALDLGGPAPLLAEALARPGREVFRVAAHPAFGVAGHFIVADEEALPIDQDAAILGASVTAGQRLRHELERWGVLSTPEDQPPSGEIIDTLTAQVIDRLDLSLTGPEAILFSPDGSRVMSVVPDGGVGIWDLTY